MLHNNVKIALLQCLELIFFENAYADKEIERAFKKNRKWGSRDRKIFAETIYETVRWWKAFLYLNQKSEKNLPDLPSQLTDQQLEQILDFWLNDGGGFLDRRDQYLPAGIQAPVRHSLPNWLWLEIQRQLGEAKAEPLMRALNEQAPVDLRVNTLKSTIKDLQKKFIEDGIQTQGFSKIGLTLVERKNVFTSDAFKKGWFEVQDRSSQEVAKVLGPQPGERILDACAGAGGKTLHIAAMMKNKGKIIAMDIHERKLAELRKRASRAGADLIEVRLSDAKKMKRFQGQFDRVLLDVPCTGLGVIRRNPDTKWKLDEERLVELQQIQREILQSHSQVLKAKGTLVYSTCSILPSENEKQIQWFLDQNPGWKLEEEKHFDPVTTGGDGFYIARLTKP